jgi:hypothetical protein
MVDIQTFEMLVYILNRKSEGRFSCPIMPPNTQTGKVLSTSVSSVSPTLYDISAIFFSYIDPETMIMDTGFTEHSGCPVFEGEKKIVTQWVRYGVSAEDRWDSFNTLGIKYKDIEALENSIEEEHSKDEL